MWRTVLGMFEGRPHMQRIIRCGLLGIDYDDDLDDPGNDDYVSWSHDFHGYPTNRLRSSSTVYQPVYSSARNSSCPSPLRFQTKERDAERKARLLEESKKSKEKAEKKRLKKRKQKERKRLEKLEKDKLNPEKNEEGKDDAEQSKAEEGKAANDEHKANNNTSVKPQASAKDTDSSDSSDVSSDEDGNSKNDSGDSEELDMTSSFVRKAALIAMHKLEQKPRPEKKEKKKMPEKEEYKTVPEKSNKEREVAKKDSAAPSVPSFEDHVKKSTELAVIGNKHASAGDFNMAVKYFTDAIKHNPKEFKLFGNRSFCFEKLQEYEKALMDAELSLGICPGWDKGLYRKGRALAGLKRYEEAAQAFTEVFKLDSSCAEAAQELMRVQITQLMEFGFTREQSSNALIIHGTVKKALEVLSKLNDRPGALPNGSLPPVQVANVTGVSPILSANTIAAPAAAACPPAQSKDALKKPLMNKPLGAVQNTSAAQSQSKPILTQPMKASNGVNRPPLELFPVWVGNLNFPVTDSMLANLFNKVGVVYSVKVLTAKRCAFVNFTKQEHCDEAIRRFHGFELNHNKLAVRYPDRIPAGLGISRSALRADDLQDENARHNENSQRTVRP
ncbi:tetratricopeptide repeat protein 31 isoform X2 [Oreochromis niloticus]|uniref:Tetratricopeptide repeat protein 31 n=2 Tax=Oreochromis TaxID=8139 RepID=I3JKW3_ORENI|nr:tetratricopeptide repeat protein 31 isoform X2 [Oreochromis niloticus]XP_031612181.1 tetratricopeptide repeat protein 31-like isoform X2 [Oreochromis aureus]